MADTTRPPGLELPKGIGSPSTPNSNASTNQSQNIGSVGRGSQPKKTNSQQNHTQKQNTGRGKKNTAKSTTSAATTTHTAAKSSNLASFDDQLPVSSQSTQAEVNGSNGKRGGREEGGKAVSGRSAFKKQWTSEFSQSAETTVPRATCLACCEPIEFFAVGECNHREMCGLCTIRSRLIFKDLDCCICKMALDRVLVDRDENAKFEELWVHRSSSNVLLGNSGIVINDMEYYDYCKSLFDRHCPLCEDGKVFSSIGLLKKHAEHTHGKAFCDLCLDHRKCFLHEQKCYQPDHIQQHIAKGDSSIQVKPHPECEYCSTTFFSVEDLFKHCEETHFKCFLCERENIMYAYFRNYDHLDRHFATKHHACRERECLEKKFIVFPTALDLQAHNIAAHLPSEKMSAKSARVVHLDFTLDSSNSASHRQSHQGHSNQQQQQQMRALVNRPPQMPIFNPDRHRPANAANANSTSQSSRDPTAFALTGRFDEPKPTTTVVNGAQMQPSARPASPALAPLSAAERSKNLIATIKAFLNNEGKFSKFRTLSADYRNSKISAKEYYQQFIQTFGEDAQVAEIFGEMVDLLPDPIKQAELRSLRETDPKATGANTSSQQRVVSNPNSMAAMVAAGSGNGPTVTRFSDAEAFPSLPGSSSGSYGSGHASGSYVATLTGGGAPHGKPTVTVRSTESPTEAFPALPNAEGRSGSNGANSGPRGAWALAPMLLHKLLFGARVARRASKENSL